MYQVAWQRILALHSGVGAYSVAMIVAAFMAGLGLGSHAGGVWSARLDPRRALFAFAAAELGIGLFGAASAWVYYDLLYERAAALYAQPWRAGLLHFLALLLPTFLMGTSLPLLVRAAVTDAAHAGRTIGVLYGLNVAGAALGAFLTPWVLVRHTGIRGALAAAAAANVLVALAGAVVAWRARGARTDPSAESPPVAAADVPPPVSLARAASLYALSGFVALSLEVLWFRIVEVAVKATAFAFGTVLGLYLAGLAVGCLIATTVVGRTRRPLRAFLLCQCALLVYAALAVALLSRLPVDTPGYAWLFEYWGRSRGPVLGDAEDVAAARRLYGVVPALLFGPPTVLMGLAFPFLQRAVHDRPETSGWKVGLLQAANIAGCVAGSLVVGLWAVGRFGTAGSLRLLVLLGLGFCWAGGRQTGSRRVSAAAAALLVAAALAVPSSPVLWRRLHGTSSTATLVDEDATGVAAIVPDPTGPWKVFVSGRHHSWLPFGGAHTRLGAAPAVVHPSPVDVAIVGLGSGDTAWAAGARAETERLTVFEISGPQPRLLRRLAAGAELPQLRAFLADPRLRLLEADGRAALTHHDDRFDLLEADALWPEAAYSGNLYSVEFFRRCAARLRPGGLMCTWAPSPRIYASFSRVFPHVIGTPSRDILIGGNEPFADGPEAWQRRLRDPHVVAYLGAETVDEVGRLLDKLIPLNRRGWRHTGLEVNEDLYPRDEFLAP